MEAVAFVTDITSHLIDLNVKLQGRNGAMSDLMSAVCVFQGKLEVFTLDRLSKTFRTNQRKKIQNHAEFLEKLIENFQNGFEDFSMGKQVLLCIKSPFLVRNVTEFSMEAQRICPWVNTAFLQTVLIELQENLSLQEAHCDPVTFWTNKISLQKMLLTCRRWPLTSSPCLLQHTAANQRFRRWIQCRTHTAADSLINTYISVSTWPSHLWCPSLRTWSHKEGVTSPINTEMSYCLVLLDLWCGGNLVSGSLGLLFGYPWSIVLAMWSIPHNM